MRAILISLTGVSEVEIDPADTLKSMYNHINCQTVASGGSIYLEGHGEHAVWADDEGLYSEEPVQCVTHCRWLEGNYPLVGNLLITGISEEGETTACTLSIEEVQRQIAIKGMRMRT